MQDTHTNVNLSTAYTVSYWLWNVLFIMLVVVVLGLTEEAWLVGFILTLLSIWHKKAVVNRTKIFYEKGANKLTFQTGRWFVRDEDFIPIKAIDNIKMDRSLPGKLLGFCTLRLETHGNEPYLMKGPSTKQAEKFRDAIFELL